jgi:hypothetical protein
MPRFLFLKRRDFISLQKNTLNCAVQDAFIRDSSKQSNSYDCTKQSNSYDCIKYEQRKKINQIVMISSKGQGLSGSSRAPRVVGSSGVAAPRVVGLSGGGTSFVMGEHLQGSWVCQLQGLWICRGEQLQGSWVCQGKQLQGLWVGQGGAPPPLSGGSTSKGHGFVSSKGRGFVMGSSSKVCGFVKGSSSKGHGLVRGENLQGSWVCQLQESWVHQGGAPPRVMSLSGVVGSSGVAAPRVVGLSRRWHLLCQGGAPPRVVGLTGAVPNNQIVMIASNMRS